MSSRRKRKQPNLLSYTWLLCKTNEGSSGGNPDLYDNLNFSFFSRSLFLICSKIPKSSVSANPKVGRYSTKSIAVIEKTQEAWQHPQKQRFGIHTRAKKQRQYLLPSPSNSLHGGVIVLLMSKRRRKGVAYNRQSCDRRNQKKCWHNQIYETKLNHLEIIKNISFLAQSRRSEKGDARQINQHINQLRPEGILAQSSIGASQASEAASRQRIIRVGTSPHADGENYCISISFILFIFGEGKTDRTQLANRVGRSLARQSTSRPAASSYSDPGKWSKARCASGANGSKVGYSAYNPLAQARQTGWL